MPFTALFDEDRLDLAIPDDVIWKSIHHAKLGDRLRCPACKAQVQAVQRYDTGTRFVRHITGQTDCPLSRPESEEHRWLKARLVEIANAHGWRAQSEVIGEGWIADVLAHHPDDPNRQWIFEVQLSGQTPPVTDQRSAVRAAPGRNVVWITQRRTSWFRTTPSWAANIRNRPDAPVVDGLWTFSGTRIVPAPSDTLEVIVQQALDDQLVWVEQLRSRSPLTPPRYRDGKTWPSEHGTGGWIALCDLNALNAFRQKVAADRSRPAPSRAQSSGGYGDPWQVAEADRLGKIRAQQHAAARIRSVCHDRGWDCQVGEPSADTNLGLPIAINGQQIVVYPQWCTDPIPDAVVICWREQVHRFAGLTMPIEQWLRRPVLSSTDDAM